MRVIFPMVKNWSSLLALYSVLMLTHFEECGAIKSKLTEGSAVINNLFNTFKGMEVKYQSRRFIFFGKSYLCTSSEVLLSRIFIVSKYFLCFMSLLPKATCINSF